GDELFAGYNRYLQGPRLIQRASKIPVGARQFLAKGLLAVGPARWDRLSSGVASILRLGTPRLAGDKAHKLANLLLETEQRGMYRSLMSAWRHPPMLAPDEGELNGSGDLGDGA